jgi:hypothetical protein
MHTRAENKLNFVSLITYKLSYANQDQLETF